jgi:hypothetical protein
LFFEIVKVSSSKGLEVVVMLNHLVLRVKKILAQLIEVSAENVTE